MKGPSGEHGWEAWTDAFIRVHAVAPQPAQVPCPSCGQGNVQVAYTGDPGSRIGYAMAWCDACVKGIYLCRVGIPEGAEMFTFDSSDAFVEARVPDIEFVQPVPERSD